ncbi:hypothetical protein SK128_003150, partial [Halocaridina rubra]
SSGHFNTWRELRRGNVHWYRSHHNPQSARLEPPALMKSWQANRDMYAGRHHPASHEEMAMPSYQCTG